MKATERNERHQIGVRVELTLADGRKLSTRTIGPACTWGGLDHIDVAGIQPGYVLLSWCEAVETPFGTAPESLE